jgi:hypothetical protein
MDGLYGLASTSEIQEIKGAIYSGYNSISGGCTDEYHRWMYNIKMINQALVHDVIMKDNSMSLQTIFEETPAIVAHFDLKVLCKGCNEENSFASIYPASFGRNTNKSFWSVDGGDTAREDNGALDAAKILIAIEEAAKTSVLSIKAFEEVKIAVTTEDGCISVLTMYNMDTEEEESTYISPEYIKNSKVVADTRKKQKCSTRSGGAIKEQQRTSDLGFNGVVGFRGGDSKLDGSDDDDDDDDDDHDDCEEDDDESGSRSNKGDDDDDSPTVSVAPMATPVPTFIGDVGPSTLKKGGDDNDNSPISSKKGGDDDDDNSEGKKQKHVRLLRLQSFCSKIIFSTCLHSLSSFP